MQLIIANHFDGTTSLLNDKTREQLIELRCDNLSHFKWYKDVYFSKIFMIHDCNQDFWKEKFLSRLLPFFATRVKDRIKN